jgi:hypothetical protein
LKVHLNRSSQLEGIVTKQHGRFQGLLSIFDIRIREAQKLTDPMDLEQCKKKLIFSLASLIQIRNKTSRIQNSGKKPIILLQGGSPLFICLLWKMILDTEEISPLAYKVPAADHVPNSSYLNELFPGLSGGFVFSLSFPKTRYTIWIIFVFNNFPTC